ncbi:cation channel family protein [Tritrichomonas foetus]|uniref:Cation channel family protein n=1 Tax=Tritrichomonas foetus TaxID=1144522 RepID=A0A1J4J7A7_9EUKA|nr:cation channel family protein [Tritrichomonas foetus]|eukprot:OHS93076.1 cation channel family protein [Tritrichomonas foetus]
MIRQRRKSNYLFDSSEARLSLTDRPRPASQAIFDLDNNIENSSESVARKPDPNQTVYSHFSFYRRLWEYIVFIVSAIPLIEASFVPIFVNQFQPWAVVPELVCDAIFIADLYVVTHTSYLSHGVLIYDKKRIAYHYGKLSIILHIIAALPISWACVFVTGWWKYLLLFATRLLRLRRAIHASEVLNRMLIYYSWMSAMLPTLFLLVSLIHLFACLFYLCALFEGLENSWVALLGWDYLSPPQHYVVSVYFVMTTILTIGFGDMTPQTSSETILVIFIQLIGVFSNAYIIGMFVSLLMDNIGATFLHHYHSLVDFLKFKHTPVDLRVEIYHYFQYKWKENHGSEDPSNVYKFVPETIRNHLKMDMCLECLMKVGMFSMASPNFRINLANILKTKEYVPDEVIFNQNDVLSDIILVRSGVVDVFIDGTKFTTASCEAFGELELFIDQPRKSTVRAVTHVTGWTLSREDFQIGIGSRPDLKEEILNIVKMLFPDYYKEIRRLLSSYALDQIMKRSQESEYSDDSDIAMNMQNSSDSESSGLTML